MFSRMFADYPNSSQSKQFVMSIFGHDIQDEDVLNVFKEASKDAHKASIFAKLSMLLKIPRLILKGPTNSIKYMNQFMNENRYNLVDKIKKTKKSKEILKAIFKEHMKNEEIALLNHGFISMGSSLKIMLLRKALDGAQGNLSDLFN